MKEYSVKINLYRGKKTFDEQGNISSEMSAMDLPTYKSFEWDNFMKHATVVGYTDGKIISVNEIVYTTTDKVNGKPGEITITTTCEPVKMDSAIVSEIAAEIKQAFEVKKKALTPEQQEIQDLKDAVAELTGKGKAKKEAKVEVKTEPKKEESKKPEEEVRDLEQLRAQYTELYGKKPSHLMKEAGLQKKIDEKLNA